MPKAVVKKHIDERLRNLIRLSKQEYRSTHSLSYISQLQFSKLAVLDLSGWIEITQDEIIKNILKRKNISVADINKFEKDHIKSNTSLVMNNFGVMIKVAVGYSDFLIMKHRLGSDYDILSSKLGSLREMRRELAHETRPSPSSTPSPKHVYDQYFLPIHDTLKKIESFIF